MLKSYGWGGGPCDFSVSPRSKSFFFFYWGTIIHLGGLFGQGLGLGLGPGLDNCWMDQGDHSRYWTILLLKVRLLGLLGLDSDLDQGLTITI